MPTESPRRGQTGPGTGTGPQANVLDDTHCACLDRVIQRTPGFIQLAKDCQDCGWDTEQAIAALEEQLAMAKAAKAKFFPNRA